MIALSNARSILEISLSSGQHTSYPAANLPWVTPQHRRCFRSVVQGSFVISHPLKIRCRSVNLAAAIRSPGSCLRNPQPGRLPASGRCPSMQLSGQGSGNESMAGDASNVSQDAVGALKPEVVGVLGGGQLGKMIAVAAAQLGVPIRVLDPVQGCPASVVAQHTVGSYQSSRDIVEFARTVDVLTVEIEHVDTAGLETVQDSGTCAIHPAPITLQIIQDKFRQKEHFVAAGVATAAFRSITTAAELQEAGEAFGWPLMLKSRTLAYDGKGNAVVKTAKDADAAAVALGGFSHGLYAEQWAPYVKELAVMVARGRDGDMASYPVTQTLHRDSICWVTESPAALPPSVAAKATRLAELAVGSLTGAGIFGVELFLMEDGNLLLNEVAPRPHNSGHYTIEGCHTSQYEQHLRAVLGQPLGCSQLKVPCAIMLNLLGEGQPSDTYDKVRLARQTPGAALHWYGKAGVTPGRKVGHVTITSSSSAEARARLAAIDPAAAKALAAVSPLQPAAGQSQGPPDSSDIPQIGIIMGSDSDLATMKAAAQIAADFGVQTEVTIVSAHRTPDRMLAYARTAADRGIKVIIAGAGGAAHLPGMVAALTSLPVIGVPVKPAGAHLDGMDALLSIVQMPKGVPVATVAIGNAANAGLLAIRIIAAADSKLRAAMERYQADMKTTVLEKAERLESEGWQSYEL